MTQVEEHRLIAPIVQVVNITCRQKIWFWLRNQHWQRKKRGKQSDVPAGMQTIFPCAPPQKTTKTIFSSHSIYSSCYTSESCHQRFPDINQCQDHRRGEEEERRLKSNTNLTLELWLFWQPGGTAAGSRRQGATSNSLLWSGTVSPHMALISGCWVPAWEASCLSSSEEMPEQLRR